ncbi:Hsp20/alpha crystallin family protein [Methanothrix sp.]|uniref:Hsp20/alpha crystallin family protein n=1 Tax=Methanothrix sp. TaxID=90426 RepID=UPI0034E195A3
MPADPYDDILKNLAKIMEEIMKNMSGSGEHHFVGYTIITGPDNRTRVIKSEPVDAGRLYCEVVETEDWIFITAEVPTDLEEALYVDIQPQLICIHAGKTVKQIELPAKIDVKHSFYDVRNRVLDIACRKA